MKNGEGEEIRTMTRGSCYPRCQSQPKTSSCCPFQSIRLPISTEATSLHLDLETGAPLCGAGARQLQELGCRPLLVRRSGGLVKAAAGHGRLRLHGGSLFAGTTRASSRDTVHCHTTAVQ